MIDEQKLRELISEATPGPWFVVGQPWNPKADFIVAGSPDPHMGQYVADTEDFDGEGQNVQENAAWIAAANPSAILALLDELETLRKQVEADRVSRDVPAEQCDCVQCAMLRDWQAAATTRAEMLASHLRGVLEISRAWQPEYATQMDIDTLQFAEACVDNKPSASSKPQPVQAQPSETAETLLPHAYLFEKLAMVMPLFQEARDALTAIREDQRIRHGISATLADRMDYAGTFSLADWEVAQPKPANKQKD